MRLLGYGLFSGVTGVALVLALAARAPAAPPHDPEAGHTAFTFFASQETPMRKEAAKSFPTDLWSQDDDFHKKERDRAMSYADSHHLPVDDVLSAIDEGLRDDWPRGGRVSLRATVPPCQPRAIY